MKNGGSNGTRKGAAAANGGVAKGTTPATVATGGAPASSGLPASGGIFAGSASSGNGALGPLNNYSTFHGSDPSVQSLLRTSDRMEQSKKVIAESEDVARNVLVDLELQRSQLQDMKGMVHDTTSMTSEVKTLLQKIADRSYRRKVFLWFVIVCLAITDITVFYLLFIRQR